MSRSIKKHMGHYFLCSVHSALGKRRTSRSIRRRARRLLRKMGEDFDYADILDRNRGSKGSKDADWGWGFFGDGYYHIWIAEDILAPEEEEFYWRLVRK